MGRESHLGQITDPHMVIFIFQEDLSDLAHVDGREPYDLRGLARVPILELRLGHVLRIIDLNLVWDIL